MTRLPFQNFRALKSETRMSTLTTVIVWIRRVAFALRIVWAHRGQRMVRYYDVRECHDVIEFVKDSAPPAAPSGSEPNGAGLSQQNRGGRG